MSDLRTLCQDAGFQNVRTYIASGNVIFTSSLPEQKVKEALEIRLRHHSRTPIGMVVRTAGEMANVLAHNPFPDAPGDRVMAIFLDGAASSDLLNGVTGQADDEHIQTGCREIYVWYGRGQGNSKLRIPAAKAGTARNMNTIAKLAEMAAQAAFDNSGNL